MELPPEIEKIHRIPENFHIIVENYYIYSIYPDFSQQLCSQLGWRG